MANGPSRGASVILSTHRPVVAADGDSAASVVAVPVIPTTVVVTVAVAVMPHSHTANGGFNSNLCGSGRNNRRGDSDTRNRQQTMVRMSNLEL